MSHRVLPSGTMLTKRYRIERLIKSGGFAAVYVATDLYQMRTCAVKETFDQSPEGQEQFQLEANILAGISHPNLPAVWDYFEYNSGQYLVMQYIDGDDLESRLDIEKHIAEDDVRNWSIQICDALMTLHMKQPPIIHRDIKPANIKITSDYLAVLVDFGIAKLYRAGGATQAAARAVTDGFSPLEQYGQGSTDGRSDIYSLGATIYNLLTGVIPPDAPSRAPEDTLIPPSQLQDNISPAMEDIVLRALKMNPQSRFQSAADMQSALLMANRRANIMPQKNNIFVTGSSKSSEQISLWLCPNCHTRNKPEASYCVGCSAPAPGLDMDGETHIIQPPPPSQISATSFNLGRSSQSYANFTKTASSSWAIAQSKPDYFLRAVAGKPEHGFVMCGDRGLALVFNDQDHSWTHLPFQTEKAFLAAAVAKGHIWAVGEDGLIAHFTSNRWIPIPSDIHEPFIAIALDSPTSGWIAAQSGALIEFHDNELNTIPMRRGLTYGISIDDIGDGWAVGSHSLLLRLYGGAWKALSHSTGWGELYAVAHDGPESAWVAGANGLLLHVDNKGWQIGPDAQTGDLRAISFNSQHEGWAVGDNGAAVWYNGVSWTTVNQTIPGNTTLLSIAWRTETEAWAINDQGQALRWLR